MYHFVFHIIYIFFNLLYTAAYRLCISQGMCTWENLWDNRPSYHFVKTDFVPQYFVIVCVNVQEDSYIEIQHFLKIIFNIYVCVLKLFLQLYNERFSFLVLELININMIYCVMNSHFINKHSYAILRCYELPFYLLMCKVLQCELFS